MVHEDVYCIVREQPDPDLRENVFQSLLLQIRGDQISVDVNGKGLFTCVRMNFVGDTVSGEPLNGLLGVLSKVIVHAELLLMVLFHVPFSHHSLFSLFSHLLHPFP